MKIRKSFFNSLGFLAIITSHCKQLKHSHCFLCLFINFYVLNNNFRLAVLSNNKCLDVALKDKDIFSAISFTEALCCLAKNLIIRNRL